MWEGEDTKKAQDCKGCGCHLQRVWKERTLWERFAYTEKCSAHSLEDTTGQFSRGQGPVDPYISMMRDSQSTLTWSVSPMLMWNKHLIKFPVAHWIQPALRRKGNNMDSSPSTPSTVLLKADTGADVNLMKRKNIWPTLWWRQQKCLKPTPIKMENYGNSAVKVLGMFHAFLRWKDKVYRQLFLCDRLWQIPQLAVKGCLFTFWEFLKPCYIVEKD